MQTKTPTISHLAKEYRELNGTHHEVLEAPPSALDFSRLVHISRPVLIKRFSIPATEAWSAEYLLNIMGEHEISVAVTPEGQGADALTTGFDGKTYFAEPHVEKMTMHAFLARLSPDPQPQPDPTGESLYLQSQNGNMYPSEPSEFVPLLPDVPRDISWASAALGMGVIIGLRPMTSDAASLPWLYYEGRAPEAVNIWIGDSRSVTSIHCDPYENIYTVVNGVKHFTLFPPTEGPKLRERWYPHAYYTRVTPSAPLSLALSNQSPVRWSSLPDPTTAPAGTAPLRISVHPGEMLYLPPGWWHHVRQTGLCIALNWWYDMEMRGMSLVWLRFLRGELEQNELETQDRAETLKRRISRD